LNSKLAILISLLFPIIISCKNKIYWEYLTHDDLENFRRELNLPKEKTFRLDTNYIRYLFSLDTSKYAREIHDHYQPIQVCYYDKLGKMISFHINCNASIGIPEKADFNWNQQNAFASFVPKTVVPLDTIMPLSKHLDFIKTFDHQAIDTTGFADFDYTIIIHWGKSWRPTDSKNLIKIVTENVATAINKKINVLYVNSDGAFYYQ
jgi:hypothetical protein